MTGGASSPRPVSSDEWIAQQLTGLPPLTDEQVARVARLLTPWASPVPDHSDRETEDSTMLTTEQHPLPKVAGVHERTVQHAERHHVEYSRRPRRRKPKPPTGRLDSMRIDPLVMKTALRLAGGDASRLTLNRDGSVYVQ